MSNIEKRVRTDRRLWAAGSFVLVFCVLAPGCARSPQEKEARYLESGKRLLEKKDYARALIQFRNASKAMPKDAEPYYQIALTFIARSDWQGAGSSLIKALELNPKHQQAQLKFAELKIATGRRNLVEEGQKQLQELVNTAPASAEILDFLAASELKLGNSQDAQKHFEEAFAKFPKDLSSAVNLARMNLAHNDRAAAEDVLKKAAAQTPPSVNAFLALGQFYIVTGKLPEAEAQFRRAVQIDPKSGPAVLSLAAFQVKTGKLDQAEQTYGQLSSLPDKQYKAYHAAFLAARGKHDQAIAEFEKLNHQDPDDRAVRAYLVREYISLRKIAEAEKLVTAAVKKHASDTDALLERSSIYLLTGRLDDAEVDLNNVLRLRRDSAEGHYLLSKLHEMRGAVSNEKNELTEVLRLKPEFLPARVQLARVMMAAGTPQLALDLLDSRKGEKDNLAVITQRSWALMALNRTAEARQDVDRGLAAFRSPELLLQDAYLKLQGKDLQLKDYDSARASLTEALNKTPEDLRILRLIVGSYSAQKRPLEAIRLIQAHAEQHPKSAPIQQFLAQLLIATGDHARARTALFAAKKANGLYTPADLLLAQLDVADGHPNDAVKTLDAVLVQQPKNVSARLLRASVEESRGNRSEAIKQYRKALDVQHDNLMALNNLAYDLAEYENQPDEALQHAQRAAELAPEAPAIQDTLGWVLYHKGLYSAALPYLEKAAEKEPSARRKCHLAMVYSKLGDPERALKDLEAAVKLDPNVPEIQAAQRLLDEAQGAR
jgi:tetratricopeptide (TPR) repeat protein